MADVLYIVIPCYNEQEVLPETARRIGEKIGSLIAGGKISDSSRVVFVDDGSRDNTWSQIAALHEKDRHFSGIKLSRNRGQERPSGRIALFRGLADMIYQWMRTFRTISMLLMRWLKDIMRAAMLSMGLEKAKGWCFKRFTPRDIIS